MKLNAYSVIKNINKQTGASFLGQIMSFFYIKNVIQFSTQSGVYTQTESLLFNRTHKFQTHGLISIYDTDLDMCNLTSYQQPRWREGSDYKLQKQQIYDLVLTIPQELRTSRTVSGCQAQGTAKFSVSCHPSSGKISIVFSLITDICFTLTLLAFNSCNLMKQNISEHSN